MRVMNQKLEVWEVLLGEVNNICMCVQWTHFSIKYIYTHGCISYVVICIVRANGHGYMEYFFNTNSIIALTQHEYGPVKSLILLLALGP
jgi:hypothetical protein